jgi:hypothetical protein
VEPLLWIAFTRRCRVERRSSYSSSILRRRLAVVVELNHLVLELLAELSWILGGLPLRGCLSLVSYVPHESIQLSVANPYGVGSSSLHDGVSDGLTPCFTATCKSVPCSFATPSATAILKLALCISSSWSSISLPRNPCPLNTSLRDSKGWLNRCLRTTSYIMSLTWPNRRHRIHLA